MPAEFWFTVFAWVGVSFFVVAAGVMYWAIRRSRRGGDPFPRDLLPSILILCAVLSANVSMIMGHSPGWLAALLLAV